MKFKKRVVFINDSNGHQYDAYSDIVVGKSISSFLPSLKKRFHNNYKRIVNIKGIHVGYCFKDKAHDAIDGDFNREIRIEFTEIPDKEETAKRLADVILNIETLEERKSDSLDFHEVSVWSVKEALEKAFELGFEAGKLQ